MDYYPILQKYYRKVTGWFLVLLINYVIWSNTLQNETPHPTFRPIWSRQRFPTEDYPNITNFLPNYYALQPYYVIITLFLGTTTHPPTPAHLHCELRTGRSARMLPTTPDLRLRAVPQSGSHQAALIHATRPNSFFSHRAGKRCSYQSSRSRFLLLTSGVLLLTSGTLLLSSG